MITGKAIKTLGSGLIGAVVLIFGSVLTKLVPHHDWLLMTGLFGGTIGLIVSSLLTKTQETNSDLEEHVDACNADLKKSMQEYRLLTEKHERVKEAFIQKLELHEQVFNTMSNGVVAIGKDGEVQLVNGPALSLLHLENEFTTESLNDVLPHFDIRSCGPISREQSVARITLLDGTTRLFGFSTSPLKEGGLVLVFQDVTASVESQERKQRSEELALVGEMVSRLSHEIKNPLASILVGVKTLQREVPEASQQGHILQLISGEVDALMKIISELLDSARPRTSSPGPVYVGPLLERCIDAHGFQASRRGVRLEIVQFPASTVVLVDEQSMLRCLGSLIQNALDACAKGDLIRIGWRELDQAGKNELVAGFSGKVVSLYVEDNGAGISNELSLNESRIFKAFVSTKVLGSGLGMTVAQAIVEEHGGVIVVSSQPNGGTKVEILLPVPEAIPCWDWNRHRSVDCTSCHVRSTGSGYYCWHQKERPYCAGTGSWPTRCLSCGFFRESSLTPFFKSRLLIPKVD